MTLAASLYQKALTIFLSGELGAGKTTFTKGLGLGLGLGEVVTSPTYALENRYGEALLHIDLFRIDPKEAKVMLAASEEFPGVRAVEWSERLGLGFGLGLGQREEKNIRHAEPVEAQRRAAHIVVAFTETSTSTRNIEITFRDLTMPHRAQIEQWRREMKLPEHIAKHCDTVGAFARKCAEHLLQRGIVARPKALQCAGELHDLFRFVDFQTRMPPYLRGADPRELEKEKALWESIARKYPGHHEEVCARFLEEQNYRALATIVRPHGLKTIDDPELLKTTEQKLLFYADKRVLFDRVVSLNERFEDFKQRYGKGVESEEAKRWQTKTKQLEQSMFGEKVP